MEETVKARGNSVFIVCVIYAVGIIGSVWVSTRVTFSVSRRQLILRAA